MSKGIEGKDSKSKGTKSKEELRVKEWWVTRIEE